MDDLERAILFTFDQSGAVSESLKSAAQAYCEQSKQSPTLWKACLHRSTVSQFVEVQFWCLQVVEDVIRHQYSALEQSERQFLLNSIALSTFGGTEALQANGVGDVRTGAGEAGDGKNRTSQSPPAPVRNKLAQIFVLLIAAEYPAGWPSVFLDVISACDRGADTVDMMCRVIVALDEEVISLDYIRTSEQNSVAMRVKDAMRQRCISQLVDCWYRLVIGYESTNSELSASVLDLLTRCVSWIDIGLVANDSWIPLLFTLLTSPQEAVHLRGGAANCLLAIVSKRMDPTLKVALLQRLRLTEVCQQLTSDDDPEVALRVTALLTGVAGELLDCLKKMETDDRTVGGGDRVRSETTGLVQSVTAMLGKVLPAVLFLMKSSDLDISQTTFQFLLAYVGGFKKESQFTSQQQEHLSQLLEVVRYRMRYDDAAAASLDKMDKCGMEEEERMCEYRKDLFTLIKNIARIAPDITQSFVQSTLSTALSDPATSFRDMEAALALFYQLGEGVSEQALKQGTGGAVAEMAAALLSATVPHHHHRLIALLFLETVVRYVRFIQQNPQYIPVALTVFLGKTGIHHPNRHVSNRGSYLLMRLVKVLRVQLTQYLDSILQSLQDVLAAIAVPPPPPKTSPPPMVDSALDERIYAFEAVGLLLGLEEVAEDKMKEYLARLLVPLCRQADHVLTYEVPPGDLVGPPGAVATLQQIILAISYLSKGFGEQLTTRSRPEIGSLFKQALDLVLRSLQRLPHSKPLRHRAISFFHRMVDTLGSSVFPFLPAAIQQLLVECEAKDLVEFIQLLNQLQNKFKSAMLPILKQLLAPLVNRIFALLPPTGVVPNGFGSNTEEVREQKDLERAYVSFLQALAVNDLLDVFLPPGNAHCLQQVISSLLEMGANDPDTLIRKGCMAVLARCISSWCGPPSLPEKVGGFKRFAMERVVGDCCVAAVLRPDFDLRDANTLSLFGEIAGAQQALYRTCGDEFLVHLATVTLPAVHCPPPLVDQYCLHLQRSSAADLRTFLKRWVEEVRPTQNRTAYG